MGTIMKDMWGIVSNKRDSNPIEDFEYYTIPKRVFYLAGRYDYFIILEHQRLKC